MSKVTPIILIIPGSFSIPSFYDPLVSHLKDGGLEALVFGLPSASRRPPQKAATMYEDAAFFSGVLASLCKSGKDVVVMGHSYGGSVASECIRGHTEKKAGEGRVLGLIYFTAAVPLIEGEFMYHEPLENSARINFSDLPLDQGVEWVRKMPWHSAPSFANELTYAGYNDVDSAYILCTEDKCLTPDFQRQMIENAKSGGRMVKVYEVAASHCAMASVPEKVAASIVEAVEAQFM
ncbi:Alpha/beta hydrolase fold-1 [Mycena rosella]|uniref:Alpha/beta hydrolase fold-1 n=1 Tax=Mycena rosella TaxID=1033263 RepID=A0AAD7CW75_MYCRO|nr:Alpha/beta hydrolase fold-1 [Mycena rosella]